MAQGRKGLAKRSLQLRFRYLVVCDYSIVYGEVTDFAEPVG